MTSGLETETAHSYFGTSQICDLLTYGLDHLITAGGPRGYSHSLTDTTKILQTSPTLTAFKFSMVVVTTV